MEKKMEKLIKIAQKKFPKLDLPNEAWIQLIDECKSNADNYCDGEDVKKYMKECDLEEMFQWNPEDNCWDQI